MSTAEERVTQTQQQERAHEQDLVYRLKNARDPFQLRLALAHFMQVFEQAGELFETLTCTEAEALAGLWDALIPHEGDWVRRAHAYGDDGCDDMHHALWLQQVAGPTDIDHRCAGPVSS